MMEPIPDIAVPSPVVQQSGVIAFRVTDSQHEFCIITGRRSGHWGIPKGRVGSYTSIQEAALCEAWQEAGLSGMILGEPLGRYPFQKKGKRYEVVVWLMQVESFSQNWKESTERSRRWVTRDQALQLVERPHLNQFLMLAADRIILAAHGERVSMPELRISALGFNPDANVRS